MKRGITLVEILVVLCIITVLIGLLFPAIQAAKNPRQYDIQVIQYSGGKEVAKYAPTWYTLVGDNVKIRMNDGTEMLLSGEFSIMKKQKVELED